MLNGQSLEESAGRAGAKENKGETASDTGDGNISTDDNVGSFYVNVRGDGDTVPVKREDDIAEVLHLSDLTTIMVDAGIVEPA